MNKKKYSVNKVKGSTYKSAFSIIEWSDQSGKWHKLRKPLGTPNQPISDEDLTNFIIENNGAELQLGIIGSHGEKHEVDFDIASLEA